ncbi:MAG: Threonine dehydrogenase and related Zn-dependent dehydrogenases, partial [uncultured Rubrobacteraceae bacterium]
EGVGLPRSRREGMGVQGGPGHRASHGRGGQDRHHDHLRHRPAHPQGRRSDGDGGPYFRPRGGRHGGRGRHGRRGRPGGRSGARLVHLGLRAVRVLPAGFAEPVYERGWLDPGPPRGRDAGRIRAHALRGHQPLQGARGPHRRAGAVPGGHTAHRVRDRGQKRPREAGRHRGRGRGRPRGVGGHHDGRALRAGQDRGRRPRRFAAGARPSTRGGRDHQQLVAGAGGGGTGDHRRARRRRGDGGGGHPRDLRAVLRAGAPRGDGREHRGPRQTGDAAPRDAVDQERNHNHGPGRRGLHADAPQVGRRGTPGPDPLRHPPVRPRRDHGRLRRVLRRGQDRRPEGRTLGLV